MRYMRAYQFVFDSPNWMMNLLCGMVCLLIPVVGPLVFLGYAFEVVEALHRQGDRSYPNFDFNRFVKYLVRGVWPFLFQLIVVLPVVFIIYIPFFIAFQAILMSGGGKPNVGAFFALLTVYFISLFVVGFLLALVLVPLILHAGMSQEFAFGAALHFLRDFWKRAWKELVLVQLFLFGSGLVLSIAGFLLCCIGVYPAAALAEFARYYMVYQLYELYLQRGGTAIPLKLEAVED